MELSCLYSEFCIKYGDQSPKVFIIIIIIIIFIIIVIIQVENVINRIGTLSDFSF